MKKCILSILLVFALAAILPAGLLISGVLLPSYYGEAYYAQLPRMVERLNNVQGKKLILIGGSNIAFGLDTALLEETLQNAGYDYTVCPMGLYAAVGTSAMLDLSKSALREGDVVIFAVEPTSDTMSTYFGATAFWKCCEDAPGMILQLDKSKQAAMVGNYIDYSQERWTICRSGELPQPEGAYSRSAFDDSCNMIYHRAGNAMALGYDTSAPIDLAAVQPEEGFVQQVNEYIRFAQGRGASVYMSFSPMNRSALADTDDVSTYFTLCNKAFDCPIISDPHDYILDSHWFYDSNFHLNTAGSKIRTMTLAKDVLTQLGCYSYPEWERPEPPASIYKPVENAGDLDCFEYEAMEGGWQITGLTEKGQAQTALAVPSSKGGKPVVTISSDALSKASNLEELTLPASIESLPEGCFRDCARLKRLILQHTGKICTITETTFADAPDFQILVPSESYHLYRDGVGCESNPWALLMDRIFPY